MKKSGFFTVILLLFTVASFQAAAQGFNSSYAVMNAGTDVYYCMPSNTSCGSNPALDAANLGKFRQGSSSLLLKGAQVNNYKCSGQDITSVRLNYRIYPSAGTPGSFTAINLSFNSDFDNGCGGKDQQWQNLAANVDVLNGLTPGNYIIEFYCDQSTAAGTQYLSNSSNNYKAAFTVYADFITTWKTDNSGISNSTSIRIPTTGAGYNYDVDWNNDGVYDQLGITGDVTHDFGVAGTYTIRIRGAFPRIYMRYYDNLKLLNVSQWGSISLTSMANAFQNCYNLNITATDIPDMSAVTDMSDMFRECHSLNGPANIGSWNTSAVTNMTGLFAFAYAFNQPLNNWTTSTVTNMSYMFAYATSFNQPVGNWNTAAVTQMEELFNGASSFNQPVNNWNTSNVVSMFGTFYNATAFNQNLGNWTLKNNVNLSEMLSNCGMDCSNYSATLKGWSVNPLTQSGRILTASGKQYNYTGLAARNYLTNTKGWSITDAGNASSSALGATTGGGQVCQNNDVAAGKIYTDAGCNSLAMITPNGASPVTGTINTCVTVDATVSTFNSQPYLQRHFDITPSANPATSTARITLYVLQSEFNAFNTARGSFPALPTGTADATGKANLRITQYSGTGTAPGNYTPGTATVIDPADADIVWNGYHWEISFNVTGFSGFYIHSTINNSALPVSLLSFNGYRNGNVNKLNWITASEQNNKGFAVERSTDGISYTSTGFVNTQAVNGNSSETLVYNFTDSTAAGSKQYYRLRQYNVNGNNKLSPVIVIKNEKITALTLQRLYPNPAAGIITVEVSSPVRSNIHIQVVDITGRVLIQQAKVVDEGNTIIPLNVSKLAKGSYLLKITNTEHELVNSMFIKQ
ncbi:MAG: BspA family leucine-rich repeat surface protein [Lacibacter sp.]